MLAADDHARLEAVLREAYGLVGCAISHLPRGMMNRGYRVEWAGRAAFLKDYDTRIYAARRVTRACETQRLVGRAGVPVPALVSTLAGGLATEAAGGVFTLSEFVVGRSFARPSIPARAARAMGRALGRIHAALEGVEPPQPYPVPDPVASRALLERALFAATAARDRSHLDEVSCQVLRYKLKSLERLAHHAPTLARLTTQLTHGDYQETNVLFSEDTFAGDGVDARLVGVVDFDNCRQQPRGAEITRCLSLCFLDGDSLAPEAWDFLAGYAEEQTLPKKEVALFAPLRAYLSATSAWPITDRYLKPEAYQSRWDRFIGPPSGWWEASIAEMTDRLVKVLGCG